MVRFTRSTGKKCVSLFPFARMKSKTKPIDAPFRLYTASFLCGAMVMVLEMTGSRVLAPYLGTSLIVWTSLIGIVLASLSFGYWYGGIVADKYPQSALLAKIIFAASVFIAVVGFSYPFILKTLTAGRTNLYTLAIVSSVVLFAVPGALLGMVSPFVVRLAIQDIGSSGKIVGRLYALSSIGSILGTFLGGFILISFLKTGTILFLIAAVLVLVAWMVQGQKPAFPDQKTALILVAVFLGGGGWFHIYGNSLLPDGLHWDTPYNHIRVYDSSNRVWRHLQTDPGTTCQSFMINDRPNELVSRYCEYNELAFHFHPDLRNMLVIGGGGYGLPKNILTNRENVNVDVVEIDPGITKVAHDWFHLTDEMLADPRLRIYHEDARRFLRRMKSEIETGSQPKYDLVFGDAFNSHYNIPFHLTTKEYMQEVSACLSDDGIFMTNVISSLGGEKCKLFQGFHRALTEVFPQVEVFFVGDPTRENELQNIVLVGFKKPYDLKVDANAPPKVVSQMKHRKKVTVSQTVPPLTDAFAPVEWYVLGE